MANILVVGLNPAWQKVYEMSEFSLGGVHRVQAMHQTASGKGINCARVLKQAGHDVTVLQVVGGEVGSAILKELDEAGIQSLHVEVQQSNRICTTLVDTSAGTETEIIEPFALEDDVTQQLVDLAAGSTTQFGGVIICGTYPKGLSPDIYSKILGAVTSEFILLDSTVGFDENLLNLVNGIKVNRSEFKSLQESFELSSPSLKYVLVTEGPRPAILYENTGGEKLSQAGVFPQTDIRRINATGAGDAVTAGLADYWISGGDIKDVCRNALSMGSASCLNLMPSLYNEDEKNKILAKM